MSRDVVSTCVSKIKPYRLLISTRDPIAAVLPIFHGLRSRTVDRVTMTDRRMTSEEQAVVLAMLAQDFPGSEELRAQVPATVVTGRCTCGCATIDLRVESAPRAAEAPVQNGVLISADVRDTGSGALLFVEDGYLSCFEVYSIEDEPAALPHPEQLIIESAAARHDDSGS
jgi:hypothetical protein